MEISLALGPVQLADFIRRRHDGEAGLIGSSGGAHGNDWEGKNNSPPKGYPTQGPESHRRLACSATVITHRSGLLDSSSGAKLHHRSSGLSNSHRLPLPPTEGEGPLDPQAF